MEYILVIILTYSNKCGVQYKTESIASFKTEKSCIEQANRLKSMYLREGKTNVKEFEYSCVGVTR